MRLRIITMTKAEEAERLRQIMEKVEGQISRYASDPSRKRWVARRRVRLDELREELATLTGATHR